MLRTITIAVGFACGAMLAGCAADTEPQSTSDHGPTTGAEPADTTARTFDVWLRGETREESVLQLIFEAGHAQLMEACEISPGASVHVDYPLASGAYADVPCAAILRGEKTIGEPRQPVASEPVVGLTGDAQQPLTPVGLLCGLLSIGVGVASTWSCEKYPDRWCPWPATAGTSTISLVCMFL
jgi:hypothetical protein